MQSAHYQRMIPTHMAEIQVEIEQHARNYGLDFFPVIFELVDVDQLNAIAAYGGFPTRYPHWRFGMEFQQLKKGYAYGLQKIYELVINNDPCYAYLLDSNSLSDHKLVMAHVYGHCDFFKNNFWFSPTNRKMMDEMANHGNRIRKYMDRFGVEQVEEFIDLCLSIDNLIDIHSPFIRRRDEPDRYEFKSHTSVDHSLEVTRFPSKPYMDPFVNPQEAVQQEQTAIDDQIPAEFKIPPEPMRDVVLFMIENAPLKPWQVDVMTIIRDEAYYFAPQAQTKIMNEGWATYWHSTIMTQHEMDASDLICYADHCSGTLASSGMSLNPYKLGLELFRDIERRWDEGRFGADYERCDNLSEKQAWNRELGMGRKKIFEVRQIHNDLTFIDEFLTLEFCKQNKLFSFGYSDRDQCYEIESREFNEIKQQLLWNLTNAGRPMIEITDGNHGNRGELLLEHKYQGVELKLEYVNDALSNLAVLWQRPVHIRTVLQEEDVMISHDGGQTIVITADDSYPIEELYT